MLVADRTLQPKLCFSNDRLVTTGRMRTQQGYTDMVKCLPMACTLTCSTLNLKARMMLGACNNQTGQGTNSLHQLAYSSGSLHAGATCRSLQCQARVLWTSLAAAMPSVVASWLGCMQDCPCWMLLGGAVWQAASWQSGRGYLLLRFCGRRCCSRQQQSMRCCRRLGLKQVHCRRSGWSVMEAAVAVMQELRM
jgi:hypothetical protein